MNNKLDRVIKTDIIQKDVVKKDKTMTIEEHLWLGRKWLGVKYSGIVPNGVEDYGKEIFGFCEEVMVCDGKTLYICGEYCGEYDTVNGMVEDIVSGDNQKAIAVLRKNEREIEVGDWCMKKIEIERDTLRTYGKEFWVRYDGNRICLMVDSEDYGVKVGAFLNIGSDWQGGLYAFNEEILYVLDRLCEKGTVEWYKKWVSFWDLCMYDYGECPLDIEGKRNYKLLDDHHIELVGEGWIGIGNKLDILAKEKDGRKIIEFKDFEELETMVNLVKGW